MCRSRSTRPGTAGSAEREAGKAEDNGVAENSNRAQSEHVGERSDQTDQAQGAAENEASSHECGISPTCKRGYGEEESHPEEDVPRDDVDCVEGRWPLPTEDPGIAREARSVDVSRHRELDEVDDGGECRGGQHPAECHEQHQPEPLRLSKGWLLTCSQRCRSGSSRLEDTAAVRLPNV